jgi:hypothetical protein
MYLSEHLHAQKTKIEARGKGVSAVMGSSMFRF